MPLHRTLPLFGEGLPPAAARITIVFVHGRGGSAGDVLAISSQLGLPDVAYVAPQADGHTWYPHSFLAPIQSNEPGISSGMELLDGLIASLEAGRVPPARVALVGFSQGACLALEFAARHARRYKAVIGLSGGLIGPPGTPRDYTGSFDGTPVFLGCSDVDAHIPLDRVHETADVFRRLGAAVDERIYPGMGHIISPEELSSVRTLLVK